MTKKEQKSLVKKKNKIVWAPVRFFAGYTDKLLQVSEKEIKETERKLTLSEEVKLSQGGERCWLSGTLQVHTSSRTVRKKIIQKKKEKNARAFTARSHAFSLTHTHTHSREKNEQGDSATSQSSF